MKMLILFCTTLALHLNAFAATGGIDNDVDEKGMPKHPEVYHPETQYNDGPSPVHKVLSGIGGLFSGIAGGVGNSLSNAPRQTNCDTQCFYGNCHTTCY